MRVFTSSGDSLPCKTGRRLRTDLWNVHAGACIGAVELPSMVQTLDHAILRDLFDICGPSAHEQAREINITDGWSERCTCSTACAERHGSIRWAAFRVHVDSMISPMAVRFSF